MKKNPYITKWIALLLFLTPCVSNAAEMNQLQFSLPWGIPFLGVLLSIALLPIILPNLWHHHFGKITTAWTSIFIIAAIQSFGLASTFSLTFHILIEEYIPFILVLLALFSVSGGILIKSDLISTPKINVIILLIATLLSSVMGTTGAAMLMIRPLIRANRQRQKQVHIIVFFIILVANIGGGITPLGDPPLFIGLLKGIDFFWTVKNMILPVLFNTLMLLFIFYWIDRYYYIQQFRLPTCTQTPFKFEFIGLANCLLLIAIILNVLISGFWQSSISFNLFGSKLSLSNLIRDSIFIIITLLSLKFSSKRARNENQYSWQPILEVAILFLGIFITIVPLLAILRESDSDLASYLALLNNQHGNPINQLYFWATGIFSAFLDNAPTYLLFFNLASGDPNILMTSYRKTLIAISMGSVFMGALTYIGNAPNFMVKSISTQNGITMPSFFGYMKWTLILLIPLFIIDSYLFL